MDAGDARDTHSTKTTPRPPADAAARATKPAAAAAAQPRREMSSLKKYQIVQKLGQGTFGVVQKAKNLDSGRLVALKQLLNHLAKEGFPITAMREITILKQLSHPNILELIDMVYEAPQLTSPLDAIHQRGCFYTVSPYMSLDLVGLLKNPKVELRVCDIKGLMQQLLRGVQYIHEQKFLHRDIKAANILVGHDGVLKIADFGLARAYHGHVPRIGEGPGGGERAYTALVVTRWYRPPELLLGETKYTTAVDLWGVGCVLGELFVGHPILVGKSDLHQAQLIFELVGGPSTIDWPHAVNLPNKADFSIGITCKRTLEAKFGRLMTPDGIALLSGLLTLNPYKRMNALDALNHEYFSNEPLPLQPSELPRFEECHEIDSERFKTASGAPVAPEPAVPGFFKGRAEPKPRPPYMSNYRQQQEYLNYSSRAGPPLARDTYVRRTKDLPPKRTAPGLEAPESKRRR